MGSQYSASTRKTRNLGLFQMALWYIKASIAVTGKGRAQGATSAKRFLIKIVSVVTFSGS